MKADRPGSRSSPTGATLLGILAIVLWSTTVAISRSLTEKLGTVTAGSLTFLIGGTVGTVYLVVAGRLRETLQLPKAYLLGCGSVFVLYTTSLYLAIGLSSTHQQVIEVGIINYLWPAMTLVFSVLILRKRARAFLVPGIIVALAGVALAMSQTGQFSWSAMADSLRTNFPPYLFALSAAVTWGLYSALIRHYASEEKGGAVPLFLLATGATLSLLRLFFREQTHWSTRGGIELLYMSLFPALAAYVFWDIGMRKGNIILVASLSYLTPLFSTIVTCAYLGIRFTASLLFACVLVIAGAVICKLSFIESEEGPGPRKSPLD